MTEHHFIVRPFFDTKVANSLMAMYQVFICYTLIHNTTIRTSGVILIICSACIINYNYVVRDIYLNLQANNVFQLETRITKSEIYPLQCCIDCVFIWEL